MSVLSFSVFLIVALCFVFPVQGSVMMDKRLSQLENIIMTQQKELNNFRAETDQLTSELKDLRAEKKEEIKLLKSELDDIRTEKNEEIKLLKSELYGIRAEKNEEIKLLKRELDDIRVEQNEEIKHLKHKLDDIRTEKNEEIDHLKKRLDMLEAEAPKNTDKEYVGEVTEIGNVNDTANLRQKRFQTSTNVAFYVYLSHIPRLNKHETLVFDVEETDTGSNYNVNDGIFDVPVTGTNVFTVTVGCVHYGFVTAEIIVNGQVKGTAFANSEHVHDDHSASSTIVVHANAGDHVFVRKGASTDNYPIITWPAYTRTVFCGWLLF